MKVNGVQVIDKILGEKRMIRLLLTKIMLLLLLSSKACGGGAPIVEFNFKDTASGGILYIGNTMSRNPIFASVKTYPGESVESVIQKLAKAIAYDSYLFERLDNMSPERMTQHITSGGTFKLVGCQGMFFLSGTETGLGIPASPKFLSCKYDKDGKELKIKWENPPDDYDRICIKLKWNTYGSGWTKILTDNSEQYVIDRNVTPYDINDLDIWVIGFKDGLPSGPSTITLSDNGTAQQELCSIPFDGIMPNWEGWDVSNSIEHKNYGRFIREELVPGERCHFVRNNSQKPYQQVLKSPAQGGTSGIWRKFLGLTPGHTYKLSARLSTLEMSPNDTEWSFSMHAVADRPGKKELSANQMAGLEPLPTGQTGPQAGRIAEFGPGKLTAKNEYVIRSADITLPEDSDSITVWLRHTGKGTSGVGFDWIKLEDLGVK